MNNSNLFRKYEELFNSLITIIRISEERILNDSPDALFIEHPNFFVKAYLINICTYLEAFLQDVAFEQVQFIKEKSKKHQYQRISYCGRCEKN